METLIKEKPKHCCVCTSTKDIQPYMGNRFRCKLCEKEGRYSSNKK